MTGLVALAAAYFLGILTGYTATRLRHERRDRISEEQLRSAVNREQLERIDGKWW